MFCIVVFLSRESRILVNVYSIRSKLKRLNSPGIGFHAQKDDDDDREMCRPYWDVNYMSLFAISAKSSSNLCN